MGWYALVAVCGLVLGAVIGFIFGKRHRKSGYGTLVWDSEELTYWAGLPDPESVKDYDEIIFTVKKV